MRGYAITFRSVTPAQRAERLLRRAGFRCALQRTPGWMQENGCGYGVRLMEERAEAAVGLLRAEAIPFRRLYRLDAGGNAEEVPL